MIQSLLSRRSTYFRNMNYVGRCRSVRSNKPAHPEYYVWKESKSDDWSSPYPHHHTLLHPPIGSSSRKERGKTSESTTQTTHQFLLASCQRKKSNGGSIVLLL